MKTATPELTRREREVASLLAQGLTNRQIAEKLFIAERTAEHHVEQIRYKLGFHNRSQAAVWAAIAETKPYPHTPGSAAVPISTSSTSPRLMPAWKRAAAIAVIAALTITGSVFALRSSQSRPAITSSADRLVEFDGITGQTLGEVAISTLGNEIAVGRGVIWEISYSGRTLSRIDPNAHSVLASYGVPGAAPPVGIAVGADSVWVATAFGDRSLWRFDPKTEQFAPPIGLSSGLAAVAYGAGALWAADKSVDLVYRVDPSTNTVTARIPVGDGPEAIAVDFGAVWVVNGVDASISRIDPVAAAVTGTIGLRVLPSAIATGHGAIWIVSEPSSLLIRIDPTTGSTLEIPVGTGPSGVAVTRTAVWVTEGVAGRIDRIDPDSYKVLGTAHVDGAVEAVLTDDRSVWATVHARPAVVATASADPVRGGTLRVISPAWTGSDFADPAAPPDALDPQIGPSLDSNELFRCCLLRTLVSHVGRSYRDGGAELQPDLAEALPEVSADGLAWTFHLRKGLHYAPPLAQVEITAADFVRALERDGRVENTQADFFSAIEGFSDYRAKRAASTSGLEVVDPYTLRVHLREITGDLPYRFALPETAPIPPFPTAARSAFGIASGHDEGFGRFLVASGPYMIEGSERLDFSAPPISQVPVSGFQPAHHLTLVRNPSWSRDADPLRPAYVDRIEITIGVSDEDAAQLVRSGEADVILRGSPPPQVLPWLVEEFRGDPRLGRVAVNSRDFVRAISMNLAVPPFDDIHVRRAVNYVIDKRALLEAHGGDLTGKILTHYVPDSLESDALVAYDPYATPDGRGSLELARQEMRQSRYDPEHGGVCGAPECKHVLALTIRGDTESLFPRLFGGFPRLGALIAEDLQKIGINLDVQSPPDMFEEIGDPERRIPMALTVGIGPNYTSASSAFSVDFASAAIGTSNASLAGATPDQLREWGYSVTSVPSLDARIHQCMQGGLHEARCWTELDVYVMEQVVPVAPYTLETVIDVVPSRVVRYAFDQSSNEIALDQLAVQH